MVTGVQEVDGAHRIRISHGDSINESAVKWGLRPNMQNFYVFFPDLIYLFTQSLTLSLILN